MNGDERLAAGAAFLLAQWRAGTKCETMPESLRPADRLEAYAMQALLERASAAPLFGWKIAATSTAGQAHIGVDGPLAGRILAEQVLADGATTSLAGNAMRVAEVEFAFRMARDLPPREGAYTQDEVLGAVASLHPAIEVPDSRFADFVTAGYVQLVADNACAHEFVLGESTGADWRGLDLAAYAPVARMPGRPDQPGLGANVLGDPRIALTWLANELSGLGVTLKAGEVVTTGTCLVPVAILPGDAIEADFGALGRVAVSFA
jgi:2-keto-4-pentenoate hydratase